MRFLSFIKIELIIVIIGMSQENDHYGIDSFGHILKLVIL